MKKKETEDHRRRKLENLYSYKPDASNKAQGHLCINIEKKKIIERSPETEKKITSRVTFQNHNFYKHVYAVKSPSTIVPELSSQHSIPTIIPVLTPYDSWKLKTGLAADAKVFVIAGNYPDVRRALLLRGWIENDDQDSIFFDLKWARNARIPVNLLEWQLFNHFPRNFELSVKWQLYENIKKTNKVTKTKFINFFPRSFRLDSKVLEEFYDNYKAIYTISLLKDYKANPSKYINEQMIVANIVCRRWINDIEKQGYLFERASPLVMNVEWKILNLRDSNEILSAYQRLMLGPSSEAYSQTVANLSVLEELDPQHLLNGQKNIWIVKAGRKSRGRDISLFDDLNKLKFYISVSNHWVVQKYIENPLIIYNKKFDIRQWVLISNSDPLTIWVYKRSYLRFSLEDYTDEDIMNPYIHLTNNSISKTSTKFQNSDIEGCMWSIGQFQEFLIQEKGSDLWTLQIFPALKKIIKYSLIAVGNLGRKKSFEILGYDFMIDEKLNPWLLEVNSSPAMDYSTVFFI